MRVTEDGVDVMGGEMVWEVMYRYLNEEVSVPEPECREVRSIPLGVKIWKHKSNCERHCLILELKRKMERPHRYWKEKIPNLWWRGIIQNLTRD